MFIDKFIDQKLREASYSFDYTRRQIIFLRLWGFRHELPELDIQFQLNELKYSLNCIKTNFTIDEDERIRRIKRVTSIYVSYIPCIIAGSNTTESVLAICFENLDNDQTIINSCVNKIDNFIDTIKTILFWYMILSTLLIIVRSTILIDASNSSLKKSLDNEIITSVMIVLLTTSIPLLLYTTLVSCYLVKDYKWHSMMFK